MTPLYSSPLLIRMTYLEMASTTSVLIRPNAREARNSHQGMGKRV